MNIGAAFGPGGRRRRSGCRMAFDYSHEVFTADDFFGRDAVFTPAGMPRRTIRVAFVKNAENVNLGGQINPESESIQAGCAFSLVSDAAKGDTLEIDGTTYTIARIQVDETGWATMDLVEVVE